MSLFEVSEEFEIKLKTFVDYQVHVLRQQKYQVLKIVLLTNNIVFFYYFIWKLPSILLSLSSAEMVVCTNCC